MVAIPFRKMHGAGNDFVVIDNRKASYQPDKDWALKLCDRRLGIGCDQLIVMEKSKKADVFMRIYNVDGSESGACGNATRCIAWLLMQEKNREDVSVETVAGILYSRAKQGTISVDMGEPKTEWRDIPLAEPRNTLHLGIAEELLMDPVAVNMGNPHAVFFVRDVKQMRMSEWGKKLEHHPIFPQRANISAVQIIDPGHVKARVWERGTGETLACGSAACAMVVAGVLRGLTGRTLHIELPGGEMLTEWSQETNHVWLTGPVALSFEGSFDQGMLL